MRPVRTAHSNLVLTAPSDDPEVRDLHVEYDHASGWCRSVWEFSPEERERIAAGANLGLSVRMPHPPVALEIVPDQGWGEDDPAIRERLRRFAAGPLAE